MDQLLDACCHLIEAVRNIDKFIIPRKPDSLVKIPLLKRLGQVDDPLNFLAGNAGNQEADHSHHQKADRTHGSDNLLHSARILVQIGVWHPCLDNIAR
ncbi:hypothetical protein D3C75_842670 [compost metagenome]